MMVQILSSGRDDTEKTFVSFRAYLRKEGAARNLSHAKLYYDDYIMGMIPPTVGMTLNKQGWH